MSTETKKITLRTADQENFEVDHAIAMEFGAVKTFFEDPDVSQDFMPLPNVSSKCLSAVIEYCREHLRLRLLVDESDAENRAKTFDEDFVKSRDDESLKEMILAANFLDIKDLLDMLNQAVADRIKNRSVEYVRKFFGIDSDFTQEEENDLRNEYAWAFEGVDPDDD